MARIPRRGRSSTAAAPATLDNRGDRSTLGIQAERPRRALRASLSGGNMQKVVLGKCLAVAAERAAAQQPDARRGRRRAGGDLPDRPQAVADRRSCSSCVSEDLPELIGLSDRLVVHARRGAVVRDGRGPQPEQSPRRTSWQHMSAEDRSDHEADPDQTSPQTPRGTRAGLRRVGPAAASVLFPVAVPGCAWALVFTAALSALPGPCSNLDDRPAADGGAAGGGAGHDLRHHRRLDRPLGGLDRGACRRWSRPRASGSLGVAAIIPAVSSALAAGADQRGGCFAKGKVPSFIVTLGTMVVYRGISCSTPAARRSRSTTKRFVDAFAGRTRRPAEFGALIARRPGGRRAALDLQSPPFSAARCARSAAASAWRVLTGIRWTA